jgi:hypothetical protein
MAKCTTSVSEREAPGIIDYKRPAAGCRVLIPLGKAPRREPKEAHVYQEDTLGFRTDDWTSRTRLQAKSHG